MKICEICGCEFKITHGMGRAKHCQKKRCIEKFREKQRKRKRVLQRGYARSNYCKSLKSMHRKEQFKSSTKIVCKVCHEIKPGPFEVCFECRQRKRDTIDTSYMFIADDVQVFSGYNH